MSGQADYDGNGRIAVSFFLSNITSRLALLSPARKATLASCTTSISQLPAVVKGGGAFFGTGTTGGGAFLGTATTRSGAFFGAILAKYCYNK